MTPAALVIALTRAGVGYDPLPSLEGPIAWPTVVDLATQHGVAPLVARALADAPAGAAPRQIMARFEAQVWRGIAACLLCEQVLGELLELLSAHALPILVLKGAALAHTLYARPELRPYQDVDLLCRPANFPTLRRALLGQGYTEDEVCDALPRKPYHIESQAVQTFVDPSGEVKVEVHFDLLQFGLVERHHKEFWREARSVTAGALTLRILAPTAQLLHAVAHAHRHFYSRLMWLNDVNLLVRQQGQQLDWDYLMWLARDEGIGTLLRHGLATAHAVLGTPWPPLPPPTHEERILGAVYRRVWPRAAVRRLERPTHWRALRFEPGSSDPRDSVYGFILLGRRREKWAVAHRYGWQAVRTR